VSFCCPATVPVTFTEKVQVLLCASVDPDRLTMLLPAVAMIEPPPQEPVSPFGVEITKPAGKVFENATPVTDDVVLLF
jgi:hypothetical protein